MSRHRPVLWGRIAIMGLGILAMAGYLGVGSAELALWLVR